MDTSDGTKGAGNEGNHPASTLSSVRQSKQKLLPVKPGEKQVWPFLFWLYLKTLGLYRAGPFVTIRRCSGCKESGFEKFASISSFVGPCEICESFLWDHVGRVNYVTDRDIGAVRLNHRGSGAVSVIWLTLILSCSLFLIVIDVIRFEHDKDDVVETLATICIQILITIPAFACFNCNMNAAWPHCAPGSWASALHPIYLVQRLRCVNMRQARAAGYFLCFGSLVFMAFQCVPIGQDLYAYGYGFTYISPLKYFSLVVGIFNFGGIAYVAYLVRSSFEKEVKLICRFLDYHIDDIDVCRLRLAETFDSFHRFREFTSGWMSMNILFSTVCVMLELHVFIVAKGPLRYFHYERLGFLLACFLVPIIAIGNISIDYVWYRMVRRISRLRRKELEFNWDKLMQFLQEQKPGDRPWQSVMAFLLSTIAVFAAVQFRILNSKALNSATDLRNINVTMTM